jgi:hypothetical protein
MEVNEELGCDLPKQQSDTDPNSKKRHDSFSHEVKIQGENQDGSDNIRNPRLSVQRCHACSAEANPKFTLGCDDAKRGISKLYSDVLKISTHSSSEKSTAPANSQIQQVTQSHSAMEGSESTPVNCNIENATMPAVKRCSSSLSSNQIRSEGTTDNHQQTVGAVSKPKPLRAEAASFISESWETIGTTASLEESAKRAYLLHGPPAMELLTPNCPEIGSQNALNLTLPNFEVDSSLHQAVFGDKYNLVDYIPAQDISFSRQYPWLTTSPRTWRDRNALANEEYKIQTADPNLITELGQISTAASPPSKLCLSELSATELKRMENELNNRILKAQIAEQSRTMAEIAQGPGLYPHTTESMPRELIENMWMPPIGPGHPYAGKNAIPHPRSREWDELANAIKLINLDYLDRDSSAQKWWEPPIPTGFDARARFNQPPRQANPLSSSLRGNGKNEWDWVNVPIKGCKYCGDDTHLTGGCPRRKTDTENMKDRCLNCSSKEHFLRDCMSLPVFDNTESRARKLQWYVYTEHWRQTLHKQHSLFLQKFGATEYPALDPGMGDPSLTFSWLNCTPCRPESHWDAIQSNVERLKAECEALTENDNLNPYWNNPEWLLEYKNCPILWNFMHKQDPNVSWSVFNPLSSVAVDAFWRTGIKAMGWDAPELPNGERV